MATVALKVWGHDGEEGLALARLSPQAARRLLARVERAARLAAEEPDFQALVYYDGSLALANAQALDPHTAERVALEECVLLDGDGPATDGRDDGGPRPSSLVVLPGGVLWEGGGLETASIPAVTLRTLAAGAMAAERRCAAGDRPSADSGRRLAETPIGRDPPDGYERK